MDGLVRVPLFQETSIWSLNGATLMFNMIFSIPTFELVQLND